MMHNTHTRRLLLLSITIAALFVLILWPGSGRGAETLAASDAPVGSASEPDLATVRAEAVSVTVLVRHLDQPKKLTLAANGDLLVALSGDGASPRSCTDSSQASCEDHSGAVDLVTPSGSVAALPSGLTSISSGYDDPEATGPVQADVVGRRIVVLYQDLDLDAKTGTSRFGSASRLGDLVSVVPGTQPRVLASLGTYEAEHEPDRGVLGSAVAYGYEGAINSDPYSLVAYRGGWAVADAGANDVLWVSPTGRISVLAVLPTLREHASARTFGSRQRHAIEAQAQAVPTAIAVGPDGALYVGELGGSPFAVGREDVYRVIPGHRLTVWARGFTSIGDIAFDARGRLDVLELDRKGLADPGLADGKPASGVLLRVASRRVGSEIRAGRRTVLVDSGLSMPTGLAVAADGTIYLTDNGTTTGGGEILRVRVS